MKISKVDEITRKYFVTILVLLPHLVSCFFYDDEWDGTDKHTRPWCRKLRSCTPNNETVCGWDKEANFLAQFENNCIFYRANCRGAGKFHQVEMVVCETKKKYDAEHPKGDEIEWIHIEGGTSASTTTLDPLTVTNKTNLRYKNDHFKTLYPEGGTLPPNFFIDESAKEKEVFREKHENKRTSNEHEWEDKVVDLLWQRGARSYDILICWSFFYEELLLETYLNKFKGILTHNNLCRYLPV